MKPRHPDYFLILIIFTLTFLGLIILSSASVVLSQDFFNGNYYFLKHQLIYGFSLGLLGFFITYKLPYTFWRKKALYILLFSLVLLSFVFIPKFSFSHGGAKRWINIGFASLQPFEFVKLSLILYLAALLSRKGNTQEVIKKSLFPFLIVLAIISGMVLAQPNTSAFGITILISALMYFLAGLHIFYMIILGGLAFIAFLVLIKTSGYRMQRLTVFLHPETDPLGIGYQINQALLAIGSGGLFGLGLGHSIQKWKYLPEAIGDSVFAIVAEELGLIGAGFIILLFIGLAWRGIRIAKNAPDNFAYLLAGGITGWLFFQAVINIAAISGLLPLTGMPLPFISYGGSALAVSLAGAGLLANISKYAR